eukprot:s5_g55.t1
MAESPESPRSPGPGGLLELRATATKLIRGVDELFPKQHIERALSKVEQITPRDCEDDDVELLLRRPPEWRKRKLRAECRLLQQQLQEKKASEEAFLKNMMTFFKDEDGKSIALRILGKIGKGVSAVNGSVRGGCKTEEHLSHRDLDSAPVQPANHHSRGTQRVEPCLARVCSCRIPSAFQRLWHLHGQGWREIQFKRRYFWDSSSESLKAPRVPKLPPLPLADTPDLEPSSVRKDPEHLLEDVPELSEEFSPQSSKSREKQPEQEPDCIQVPAGLHSASHDQPMQCQRHLHSLLPQAVPTQHHRMCSPPRIPVYTATQNAQNAQNTPSVQPQIGWQFRSRPVHGFIAEPSTVPKMRVSVSPPRLVAAPPYAHSSHSAPCAPGAHSAQLLGASCRVPVGWCSGASIRVPSPVPEGVRAEPRWRNTVTDSGCGSCQVPPSFIGMSWELPSGRSPPAPRPAPRPVPLHVPLQTPLPAPPVLRMPLRSPSPVWHEAVAFGHARCQLSFRFVFGAVGNENLKTKRERENVFLESCGAKEDMLKLIRAWEKIDPEDFGRVEVAEVQRFADRLMIDVAAAQAWQESNDLCVQLDPQSIVSRMPPWIASTPPEDWPRFVQRLSERLTAALSAVRKSSFCFEDLMRLIWPCSSVEDLKQMCAWCEEINNTRDKYQVSPPPVLPQHAKDALKAVFDHFDKDGGGKISTNELVMSGLVDKDGAKDFIRKAADANGEIGLKDFCEMLCPHGYRATEQSVVGSTALGRVARLDKNTRTWRLKEAKPLAAVRYRYSSFGRASRLNLGIVPGQKRCAMEPLVLRTLRVASTRKVRNCAKGFAKDLASLKFELKLQSFETALDSWLDVLAAMLIVCGPVSRKHFILSLLATSFGALVAVFGRYLVEAPRWISLLGVIIAIAGTMQALLFLCQLQVYGWRAEKVTVFACNFCGMQYPTFEAASSHEHTCAYGPGANVPVGGAVSTIGFVSINSMLIGTACGMEFLRSAHDPEACDRRPAPWGFCQSAVGWESS